MPSDTQEDSDTATATAPSNNAVGGEEEDGIVSTESAKERYSLSHEGGQDMHKDVLIDMDLDTDTDVGMQGKEGYDGYASPNALELNPSSIHQLARTEEKQKVALTGFVSKVGHGVGRSDTERQYVYVNGRPVDIPKVNRIFNDVSDD